MIRENGHCPVYGRVHLDYLSESDDPTKGDVMVLVHIINRSISKGIIRGSEGARQKVGTLPVPWKILKLFPLFEA